MSGLRAAVEQLSQRVGKNEQRISGLGAKIGVLPSKGNIKRSALNKRELSASKGKGSVERRSNEETIKLLPVRIVPSLRPGDNFDSVKAVLGPPDKTSTYEEYQNKTNTYEEYQTFHYYKLGVVVDFKKGALEKAVFFGEPRSDIVDPNGNYVGLFDKNEAWYRPAKWSFRNIEIGMSAFKVLEILGPADRTVRDQDGNSFLTYTEQKLQIKLDSDHRVVSFAIVGP